MSVEPYEWIVQLKQLQRKCRLNLVIRDQAYVLSFDDAIEVKIEIATVLENGFPSANEVIGSIDRWKAKFFPNKGGFSIVIHDPAHPIATLVLTKPQAVVFSEELQDFIDHAGQRS